MTVAKRARSLDDDLQEQFPRGYLRALGFSLDSDVSSSDSDSSGRDSDDSSHDSDGLSVDADYKRQSKARASQIYAGM